MGEVEEVVIVGAGIAGLAAAVALKTAGVRAVVLERWEELRATGAGLNLFPNAWIALDALGVSHKLTSLYSPSYKGLITNVCKGTIQEVSMTGSHRVGTGPTMVHRKALLEALAEELPPNTIRFSSKLSSIELDDGSPITLLHMDDGTIIKTKILIGCDGVNSIVARWLGLGKPVSCGRWAVRGLAVFPQGHGFSQVFQHFHDVGQRGGFIPLNDKELYWFLFFTCNPFPQGEDTISKTPEWIQKQVSENFAKTFPPIFSEVVQHSELSTITLAPLKIRLPWDIILKNVSKRMVTVAGDAMHPMTPDLGQGGCIALEDAVVLGRHIGESYIQYGNLGPGLVAKALEKYAKERKWRAAGLITGSYMAGLMQQEGLTWWIKLFRDFIFYKFLYQRVFNAIKYNCGSLPNSSSESEGQSKID
ncbi:hypothetical protein LguiA_003327 [Lonicera macranthoides]